DPRLRECEHVVPGLRRAGARRRAASRRVVRKKKADLPPVVAVDGPSGVGKGMVTRHIAAFLQWHRLDSGALYRIVALAAKERGVNLKDTDAVAAVAPLFEIKFTATTEKNEGILVNGANVTR